MASLAWFVSRLSPPYEVSTFRASSEVGTFLLGVDGRDSFLLDVGEDPLRHAMQRRDPCGGDVLVTERAVLLLALESQEGAWFSTDSRVSADRAAILFRVLREDLVRYLRPDESAQRQLFPETGGEGHTEKEAPRNPAIWGIPNDTQIRELPLSRKVMSSLEVVGIDTAGAISEEAVRRLSENHLLDTAEADILIREMCAVRDLAMEAAAEREPASLRELYGAAISKLAPRERDVFEARNGRHDPALTLQEVGKGAGVTRERIRQIEQKANATLTRTSRFRVRVRLALMRAFERARGPLFVDSLAVEDAFFDWPDGRTEFTAALLILVADQGLRSIEIDGRHALVRSHCEDWRQIMKAARELVEPLLAASLSEDTFPLVVDGAAKSLGVPEMSDRIRVLLLEDADWSAPDEYGARHLVSFDFSSLTVLRSILEASETPLALTDLCQRFEEAQGRTYAEAYVRRALARLEARVFERGVYGLPKHLRLSPSELEDLVAEAESLVAGERESRQWHTSEIAALLREAGHPLEGLSVNELRIALEHSTRLEYLGRLVWKMREDEGGPSSRLGIRDLAIGLLREAGVPLTTRQLRDGISKVRGVNATLFMLQPGEGIARIGANKWGLIARDFGPMASRGADIDLLYAALSERNTAVDEEDIAAIDGLSGDLSPRQLIGLAQMDSRFRMFRGGFVGCAEWNSSGRIAETETLRALRTVIPRGAEVLPNAGEELQADLERALGRPVSRERMWRALNAAGYEWSRARFSWVMVETTPEES